MTFDRFRLDRADPRPNRKSLAANPWLAALIALVLGMSLTLWLVESQRDAAEQEAKREFVAVAEKLADDIHERLQSSERLVRTMQSVFMASDTVTPEEFERVFANLTADRAREHLQALVYAKRVVDDGRVRYVTGMFAPSAGNQSLMGLDVTTQPANLAALVRARDTGLVSMSATFTLKQSIEEGKPEAGMILRLPVYAVGETPQDVSQRRLLLQGSLGASFRIRSLLDSVLPANANHLASVQVDDVSSGVPQLLYRRQLAAGERRLQQVEDIQFGGRSWRINVQGLLETAPVPWLASRLWLGCIFSLLVAALAWSLVSTRERAILLANATSVRYLASEERFRKSMEMLPSLVLVVRCDDSVVVYQNAAANQRLGTSGGTRTLDQLFDPRGIDMLFDRDGEGARIGELQVQSTTSDAFWANVAVSSIEIDGIQMWLVVASDISEQRQLTERLSYQASHDSLTKLLNRREFEHRVEAVLALQGPREGALLFIDLDQFKLINDTSGHQAGDALLVQLAVMMRERLRPNDVLGRLGGDEFGVLLSGVRTVETALLAAERLRRSLEAFAFSWEQRTYNISGSIGAVMLSEASTRKELFADADAACYLAKEAGRNRVHFHSEQDSTVTTRLGEMDWAGRIRDALREGRLLLDYQELHAIQLGGDGSAHLELLLRLQTEDGRVIMPGAFLPAAERFGLMPEIDRWVVRTALINLDRLHPSGGELATCAINLSAASLEDAGLLDLISTLIHSLQINPKRLLFEITETVAMRDFAASSALIARLRGLGCRVALDDFGSGMCSFGYLKNLELDMVKIDGGFVQEITCDRMSQSIVRAVTEIGHLRGLQVVAEWVSSIDMIELLRELGVDSAQGFALHKPERVVFQRNGNG